jgi:Domain of unknown function (DUF4105)
VNRRFVRGLLAAAALCAGPALAAADGEAAQPDAAFAALHAVAHGGEGDPAEAFAHQLAAHRGDPQHACRHPLYARYFQARFGTTATAVCQDTVPLLLSGVDGDAGSPGDGTRLLHLDPQRVAAVHLLFGGAGEGWASRFGHVALRLVVCPHAGATPRQCDENLQEHVVLGFMASVDGLDIDPVRGLFGGYPAQLTASPFMSVYRDYAINEFREVYSLPLRLAPARVPQVLRELAEVHWQFSAGYAFFTNNCATMLQNALRVIAPEVMAPVDGLFARPDRLFERLRGSAVADGRVLDDLEQAERDGHYFSSTRAFFERAAEELLLSMQAPWFLGFGDYAALGAEHRRAAWSADPALVARLARERHLHDAQLMLEEWQALQAGRQMLSHAARYFDEADLPARLAEQRERVDPRVAAVLERCLVVPVQRLLQPLPRHDGIPAAPEALPQRGPPMPDACAQEIDGPQLLPVLAMLHPQGRERWEAVQLAARELHASVDNVLWLKSLRTAGTREVALH